MSRTTKDMPTSAQSAQKVVDTIQETILNLVLGDTADKIVDDIVPVIEQRISDKFGFLPEIHEIRTEQETKEIVGTLHEKFDEVLKIVSLDIPVYLTGKTGTGKNVICKQVAEALGLDFYFTNAVTQEYKLTGFIDANGKYQETQFYKAFTNGGLFFLDEIDASIPEVLVILNAAIANRYFDFPVGKIEANPNFRVVAAGNTVGTGADNNYTGRYCLDRASLDRFAMVNIDYSPKIEEAICDNNQELLQFCRAFRDVVDAAGIECLCSYRTIIRISKLEKVLELSDVIKISLLKGLEKDDIEIIKNKIKAILPAENRYYRALCGETFYPNSSTPKVTAPQTKVQGISDEDLLPF